MNDKAERIVDALAARPAVLFAVLHMITEENVRVAGPWEKESKDARGHAQSVRLYPDDEVAAHVYQSDLGVNRQKFKWCSGEDGREDYGIEDSMAEAKVNADKALRKTNHLMIGGSE